MSEGEVALRTAAKEGDNVAITKLLGEGVKQTVDEYGDTPLLLATSNYITEPKFVETVRSLLDADADVNTKNKDGNAAVHNAASNGNLEIMELLLEYGADLEMEGELKMVPLGLAATKKHHAVVNLLVKRLVEEKKFSNKQVEWMNTAETESQQQSIYRALTSIFHEKSVVQELLKFGIIDAILRGMKKFSKKSIQTSALQLLKQVISLEEGVVIAKKSNVKEVSIEACKQYSGDPVVEHLLHNVVSSL